MTRDTVDVSDDELASACADRDESPQARRRAEDAFRTLYDRHAKRLLAFLGGRLPRTAIDDVHQDVWAKVWQAVPGGYRGGNFRAWVHQIARNAVVDHRRKRTPATLLEDGNLIDHRGGDDGASVEAERRAALAKCLQKLERANASIADLVRSRVAGESYEAYCGRTGMPADRAYRAFHHAKAQLQACVESISP